MQVGREAHHAKGGFDSVERGLSWRGNFHSSRGVRNCLMDRRPHLGCLEMPVKETACAEPKVSPGSLFASQTRKHQLTTKA